MLNVVQGFRVLPNLVVVRVCIFACTRGNTEILAQIEQLGPGKQVHFFTLTTYSYGIQWSIVDLYVKIGVN